MGSLGKRVSFMRHKRVHFLFGYITRIIVNEAYNILKYFFDGICNRSYT